MAPYSDPSWDSDYSDDSESEENRMETKCEYCSKSFYDRCWDHSKWLEKALVKKCEIFDNHNCTHKFKCEGCDIKFLSQDKLDVHGCAEKYQCDVCLKRFPSIDKVNEGQHHFRRKKKFVDCNNFIVRISKNGKRMINIKPEKYRAKEGAKKEQEKAANKKAKKMARKKKSEEAKKKENKVWSNMKWSNDIVRSNNKMRPETYLYENIFC